MSTALDFETLAALAGGKSPADVPCPWCGPERSTRATQRKPTLRIWREVPDYLTFRCARCGEHGWASDRRAKPVSRAEWRRHRRVAEDRHIRDEVARRDRARWLWAWSVPIAGTIAETYLRSRGIIVSPPTLRFLPARGEHAAAMVAAYGHPTEPEPGRYELSSAGVRAVHLTRLRPDGLGKAPDAEGRSKIMVGVTEGWPVALMPPNDAGGGLVIAEGIEDALSLHRATGLGAWAAGAACRLPKLAPLIARLSYVESVTIAMDSDAAGRLHAQKLARELRRLRGRSLEVTTIELGEAVGEAA